MSDDILQEGGEIYGEQIRNMYEGKIRRKMRKEVIV